MATRHPFPSHHLRLLFATGIVIACSDGPTPPLRERYSLPDEAIVRGVVTDGSGKPMDSVNVFVRIQYRQGYGFPTKPVLTNRAGEYRASVRRLVISDTITAVLDSLPVVVNATALRSALVQPDGSFPSKAVPAVLRFVDNARPGAETRVDIRIETVGR